MPSYSFLGSFSPGAGVPVTSPQFYSAGHTGDIRQALVYISQLYPRAPLLGLGFSLGANVLTRYLAEEGEQSRLKSGCALACVSRLLTTQIVQNRMHCQLLRLFPGMINPRSAANGFVFLRSPGILPKIMTGAKATAQTDHR
jgi:hypothetical protein